MNANRWNEQIYYFYALSQQQLQMFYNPPKRLEFVNPPQNKSQVQIDRSKSKSFRAKISLEHDKRQQNPQQFDKNLSKNQTKQSTLNSSTIKDFKTYLRSPQNTTVKLTNPQPITHNLSSTNLRTVSKNTLFTQNNVSQTKYCDRSLSKNNTTNIIKQNIGFLNSSIKLQTSKQKNSKDLPSFIKSRQSQTTGITDIQVVNQITKDQCFLVRHKKTAAFFQMKIFSKKNLGHPDFFSQFKEYLKNTHIKNRLLANFIGYTTDQNNIYIFQQYLHGVEISSLVRNKDYQFNESELGVKIYQILTVMSYLSKIKHPHGSITSNHIIYTLNTCKFKRQILNNPYKTYCDEYYDIWCIGNIIFEIITGEQLVPVTLLNQSIDIGQVFNSPAIVKCIQRGLKKLEEHHLSRELLQFLIASIWTVQHKKIKFQTLFKFEFIKIFKDDDIWLEKDK